MNAIMKEKPRETATDAATNTLDSTSISDLFAQFKQVWLDFCDASDRAETMERDWKRKASSAILYPCFDSHLDVSIFPDDAEIDKKAAEFRSRAKCFSFASQDVQDAMEQAILAEESRSREERDKAAKARDDSRARHGVAEAEAEAERLLESSHDLDDRILCFRCSTPEEWRVKGDFIREYYEGGLFNEWQFDALLEGFGAQPLPHTRAGGGRKMDELRAKCAEISIGDTVTLSERSAAHKAEFPNSPDAGLYIVTAKDAVFIKVEGHDAWVDVDRVEWIVKPVPAPDPDREPPKGSRLHRD